jgi:hypothetical protein
MKTKSLIASLASFGLSVLVASSAQAATIAGWDFSQYGAAGFLTLDFGTFVNTLQANYSDLDPNGAGAESQAFGIMRMDGNAGSTFVDPDPGGTPAFIPTDFSLTSNLTAPAVAGAFDSHGILFDEGQGFTNFLSMTAQGGVSVVFQADLTSTPQSGEDWVLTFGGKTFAGVAPVSIAVSTNGTTYTSLSPVNLTTVDTPFSVPLSGLGTTPTAYVRLSFAAPGTGGQNQAILDNLALSATLVPEPGTTGLFLAGLVGLVRFGSRRL